jgi:hypothetical protein
MKAHISLVLVPAVLLATALASGSAHAQNDYPIVVQNHLGLSYAPPCSLCHAKGNTGTATVTTPFGWSMRAKGLVIGSSQSVTKALDALRDDHTDSDGDGVSDIDELVARTDPNSEGPVPIADVEQPGYGCGGVAEGPRRGRQASAAWPLSFLFALAWRVRRAR